MEGTSCALWITVWIWEFIRQELRREKHWLSTITNTWWYLRCFIFLSPFIFGISNFSLIIRDTRNVVENKVRTWAWLDSKAYELFAILGCPVFKEKLPSKQHLKSQFIVLWHSGSIAEASIQYNIEIYKEHGLIFRGPSEVSSLKIQLLKKT